MDKKTIGIIVKNDYDDILYYENNFFIKIDINKKDDLSFILEEKLSEILDKKAFRIDKISKKIPKLDLLDKDNNKESIVMYLVKVYMYSDNSDFLHKEDILNNISTSLYKDYYVKYIMRYNDYRKLVESYVNIFIYLFAAMIILKVPFQSRSSILFDNFWLIIFMYIALPLFILYKFIIPSIVNYLVNYDISEKSFKISKWLYLIADLIFLFALFKDIWN